METASWVIVDRKTGNAVAETFNISVASRIDQEKYKAIPIAKWLASLNNKATA